MSAVERFRLEVARAALERSHASLEQIAESTGFGDRGRMRRAFLRTFGLPPQTLHGARFSAAIT
jgi:transcriptional regulator GlxA family with amidase domain